MERQRRRGRKKGLEETALRQLNLLWEGDTLKEPLHPYVAIYLLCKEYGDGMSGRPCLPETNKSILDQDAELMLAFSVFGAARVEFDSVEKQREEQLNQARPNIPQNLVGFP